MRRAAAWLRNGEHLPEGISSILLAKEGEGGFGVWLDDEGAECLATILDSLADQAEQISNSRAWVDHEPYLSATQLAMKIVGT